MLDCLLDAPLIRKIGTSVTVVEEHSRHAVRLNQDVDRRHVSVDRDETEAALGSQFHRRLDSVDHHKRSSVSAVNYKE